MDIKLVDGIARIPSAEWNGLAGIDYPFLTHEFLLALEQSGSVCKETGWQPQHLLLYDGDELVALMPLYLKHHSRGEYVFDHEWSYAALRRGLSYYPKWVTSIPFTPCQGPRIAVRKGFDTAAAIRRIASFLKSRSGRHAVSSWHCLFPNRLQADILRNLGLAIREDVQYHWFNRGYRDFQDFLDAFSSRNRKKINRERRKISEQGIKMRVLEGPRISEPEWMAFFRFYRMTYLKKGMRAYLNEDFFRRIGRTMKDRLLLVVAAKDGNYVGAALSFIGKDALYGRYWGCLEEYSGLHFETCYYQGLEFCIGNGLERFDSGAQGEHKISRGFEPVVTRSAHWIKDAGFSDAIKKYLEMETEQIREYKRHAEKMLPFRRDGTLGD
ncbi:MAG: GNAT family N-acetyltransferase [Gammaproteobacteria bacterium]